VLFTEFPFLAFFAVCFGVHWALPSQRERKPWLLLCSYLFYAWWDWRFLGLILLVTVLNYAAALRIVATTDPRTRKRWIRASLVGSLSVLGAFKYFDFFVASATEMLRTLGLGAEFPVLQIVLPVGISFFTFQALSYSLDIYRGKLRETRHFFDFALYIAFFPQLVAGPIVRARDFLPQLERLRRFADIDVRRYLVLFAVGFFKKACVSNNVSAAIDPLFAAPWDYGSLDLCLAALGYTIQIYCDFSGYSDMAIAIAGLLGYELTLNFDFPYFSRNVREFWRRWHISLSTWLRDYLYVPLGGSRHGSFLTGQNLMITMLLGGLWHGAAWTFVCWGGLHGAALLVHRQWSSRWPARADSALRDWTARTATFVWVVFCFSLFRSHSLESAAHFWSGILSSENPTTDVLGGRWAVIFLGTALLHVLSHRYRDKLNGRIESVSATTFSFAYGAVCAGLLAFTPTDSTPFIYFQF
jgi:alginate O-acetyltransferase complex protein AlgI